MRMAPGARGHADREIQYEMQDLITRLLIELGEDPAREGLVKTPRRVEKALRFLTSGYAADIDEMLNGALFSVDYSEMVIVRDIDFYSLCEHHLLPFFGKCHVAYIPNGRVIGLSKIPRLVDIFARRLQLQERMTNQIAETIRDEDQPARRRRGLRRHASVHGDARRREAELLHHHERDAGGVPRSVADADGVSRAAETEKRQPVRFDRTAASTGSQHIRRIDDQASDEVVLTPDLRCLTSRIGTPR